jgi:beta-1,4-N-acetylglucosaminyltransferase
MGVFNMIFVTVGSAPQDFTRLVRAADDAAAALHMQCVIQRGFTRYQPRYATSFEFVAYADAIRHYAEADIIISHASAGPVMYARRFNKPLIVFPRDGGRREHIDNHQMDTARAIENSSAMVEVVYDAQELGVAVTRAREKAASGLTYGRAPTHDTLIATMFEFVNR